MLFTANGLYALLATTFIKYKPKNKSFRRHCSPLNPKLNTHSPYLLRLLNKFNKKPLQTELN